MTAVIALTAFALCWLALALAVAAAYLLASPLFRPLHPQPRAALLFALGAAPLTIATLVAVLGFAPLIGGWVVAEHCHASTGCTTHVPVVHADALYTGSLVMIAVFASGALLWSIARRLRRSLLVASSLRFLAERSDRQPYEVIESPESFAYCVGFLRPHVVLSRGIIERLSEQQLAVVVRHEQAHAARRDNLRLWIAALALLPCPRRLKQPLLADLALAAEHACDRSAATVGGPELVVETLRALAAAAPASGARTRAAFESRTTLASRIGALRTSGSPHPPAPVVSTAVAVAYFALAIPLTDLVHHGTELLLAALG